MTYTCYLPAEVRLTYLSRVDLQSTYDLATQVGLVRFYVWWKQYAEIHEYKYVWLPSTDLIQLLISSDNETKLPIIYLAILEDRPDLRDRFLSGNTFDFQQLNIWFTSSFLREYFYVHFPFFLPIAYSEPYLFEFDCLGSVSNTSFEDYSDGHITSCLFDYYNIFFSSGISFSSLKKSISYSLSSSPDLRIQFLIFLITNSSSSINSDKQNSVLFNLSLSIQQLISSSTTLQAILGINSCEIDHIYSFFQQFYFDLSCNGNFSFDDIPRFFSHLVQDSSHESNPLRFLISLLLPKSSCLSHNTYILSNSSNASSNIDICGLHSFQLGIGEDARLIYKSLSASFRVNAIEPPFIPNTPRTPIDYPILNPSSDTCLVVLPPPEILTLYLKQPLFFDYRTLIALCPWELSSIPLEYRSIFNHFNLILVPSNFVKDSFSRVHNNVHVLNHYVDIPNHLELLPGLIEKNTFYYLFSADCNSFIERKNPFSVLYAFQAFLKLIPDVYPKPILLFRLTNLSTSLHSDLIASINSVDHVQLIDEPLSYSKYLGLISAVQCYVSPHRSEGFGRNIAEAMYLGTPVICSNYSGNLDFCDSSNSYLINGNLVDVPASSYPHASDMKWFDPDHSHLVELLLDVFTDYGEALNRSRIARENVTTKLSHNSYLSELLACISDYVSI